MNKANPKKTPFTAEHRLSNVHRMQFICCAGINDNFREYLSLFFVGTLFRPPKLFPLLKLMHDVHEDIMLKGKLKKARMKVTH